MIAKRRARPRTRSLASADDLGAALARRAADASPVGAIAVTLSHLGRGGIPWFVMGLAVGSGRRPLTRPGGSAISLAAIAAALGGSSAVARTLGRRRPCDRGVRALIPCPDGGSFPSDQAAAAFAGAEVLAWLAPAAGRWLRGSATAIAVARVAVGAHYPSDVVAGALFGRAIGRAARALGERHATGDDVGPDGT